MLREFCAAGLALVAAACSTQAKVYVYPMASSDAYLTQFVSALKSKGYAVETRREFPPSYLANTKVVFGPGVDAQLQAERIKSVLLANGHDSVDVGAWRIENHRFTSGNMGVYLFEPGKTLDKDALARQALADIGNNLNDYHNDRCGTGDIVLTLHDNGSYRLTRLLWYKTLGDYREQVAAGFWSQSNDAITVSGEDGSATFQKAHSVIDDAGRRLH